jgi:hypothetical protein
MVKHATPEMQMRRVLGQVEELNVAYAVQSTIRVMNAS